MYSAKGNVYVHLKIVSMMIDQEYYNLKLPPPIALKIFVMELEHYLPIRLYFFCVRAVEAIARLHGCAGAFEPNVTHQCDKYHKNHRLVHNM